MKGIVLAGGTGSRLFPLTKITNKHLLPIYDKPMIFYPIQALVDAGIRDILLVTGGQNSGDFLRLLANGKKFGLAHLNYTYQEGEGGIADALALVGALEGTVIQLAGQAPHDEVLAARAVAGVLGLDRVPVAAEQAVVSGA